MIKAKIKIEYAFRRAILVKFYVMVFNTADTNAIQKSMTGIRFRRLKRAYVFGLRHQIWYHEIKVLGLIQKDFDMHLFFYQALEFSGLQNCIDTTDMFCFRHKRSNGRKYGLFSCLQSLRRLITGFMVLKDQWSTCHSSFIFISIS